MKFEEVVPALREGKSIKRKAWGFNVSRLSMNNYIFLSELLDYADWEIVEPNQLNKEVG